MPDGVLVALDRLETLIRKWDEEAHPRNPAGSPEGGEFTSGEGGGSGSGESSQGEREGESSSAPVLRPVADTVRGGTRGQRLQVQKAIQDARIPDLHGEGLRTIKIASPEETGALARRDPNKVGGVYAPSQSRILLSTLQGTPTQGTAVHEIGHHVFYRKLTGQAVREWAKISNGGKTAKISGYARTNTAEHFAEAYMKFVTSPSFFATVEPQAYAFMQAVMSPTGGKVFPAGKKAGAAAMNNRRFIGAR